MVQEKNPFTQIFLTNRPLSETFGISLRDRTWSPIKLSELRLPRLKDFAFFTPEDMPSPIVPSINDFATELTDHFSVSVSVYLRFEDIVTEENFKYLIIAQFFVGVGYHIGKTLIEETFLNI